jgi:hypothetical protein
MRWFLLTTVRRMTGPGVGFAQPPIASLPKAPLQRQPAGPSNEDLQSLDGYWIYEARAVPAGFVFCFNAVISVFAAGPEECGFCPVISRPSLTT